MSDMSKGSGARKGARRQNRSSAGNGKSPGAENAAPRRDILASEVLDKAAALFSERGFAATNLQDIAERVGLSRTSIYHYFESKDVLLHELVRGVTKQATQIFDHLDDQADMAPPAKVHEAALRLVHWVADPKTHFKLVDRCEHELPAAIATVHRQAKRRVLYGMKDLIDAGVLAGEFRAVDSRVAAFAIIGMCNWTAWWFVSGGERSIDEVARGIADQAVASLRRAASTRRPTDLTTLTNAIRSELDLIDRVHGGTKSRDR